MSETPQGDRRTRRGRVEPITTPEREVSTTETEATKLNPAQYEETGHETLPAQYEF